MRLLVCGGAGFIGSNFVRLRLAENQDEITVLDKLTYAGRRENLEGLNVNLIVGGIEDPDKVAEAIEDADAVVNFAAETHVDRSITEPDAFVNTHALGTYVLLEAARARGIRYVQVSTDEVYGSIETGSFTEQSPLQPSSPYSATKAGADLLVASYHHTYGLESLICRGSNNYGPYQYPEKLIPLMVLNAMHGDKLPVYGDGMHRHGRHRVAHVLSGDREGVQLLHLPAGVTAGLFQVREQPGGEPAVGHLPGQRGDAAVQSAPEPPHEEHHEPPRPQRQKHQRVDVVLRAEQRPVVELAVDEEVVGRTAEEIRQAGPPAGSRTSTA